MDSPPLGSLDTIHSRRFCGISAYPRGPGFNHRPTGPSISDDFPNACAAEPHHAPRYLGMSLFQSDTISISTWECTAERGASAERTFPFHAVAFAREGSHEILDGRGRVTLDPTQAVFFNPNEPYQTSHHNLPTAPTRGYLVALSAPLATALLRVHHPHKADDAEPRFHVAEGPVYGRPYLQLLTCLRGMERADPTLDREREDAIIALVDAIVARAYQRSSPTMWPLNESSRAVVYFIRHFICEHYSSSISLAAVATLTGLSPYHICRIFRASTGMSIHRYLIRIRLSAAVGQLCDGVGDLAAIAFDVGFSSHSHFTAAFRAEFGITPSAARRRMAPASRALPETQMSLRASIAGAGRPPRTRHRGARRADHPQTMNIEVNPAKH